jgi:catalase
MATKKSSEVRANAKRSAAKKSSVAGATTSARATVSGPSRNDARRSSDALAAKMEGAQELASAMRFNPTKPGEYGRAALDPQPGAVADVRDVRATASTLTEAISSEKTGNERNLGVNPGVLPLDRVRTDGSGQRLTTNQGVPVADNQHSLKAGLRGPALLEDFILREKITHFDHERIPERIVHARGSAAHGYFECYQPMTEVTRASLFAARGKRTPVFVRFSTVVGERGSTDTRATCADSP